MSELAKELTAILDKVGSILPTNSISIQESGKDAKLNAMSWRTSPARCSVKSYGRDGTVTILIAMA